ncbi:hypothetical protein QBC41DRAFT_236858 [Cercophora samala]|uniref:Uncharacterized protein n=1 Tax=Cercophora samala TaxID=330535 RepID=A0AA40D4C5_9PEZI|nr:hypothetical protein QBC41DRAFT_236858 [Cercophora samala]
MSSPINQGLLDYFRLVSETLKRIEQESEGGENNGLRSIELNDLRNIILCGQGTAILNNILEAQAKVDAATSNLETRNKELIALESSIDVKRCALEQETLELKHSIERDRLDLERSIEAQRDALEQERVDLQAQKQAFLDDQAMSIETREAIMKTETALAGIMAAQNKFGSDLGTLLQASGGIETGPSQNRARIQDGIATDGNLSKSKGLLEQRLERLATLSGADIVIKGKPEYYRSNIETALLILELIPSDDKWVKNFHSFCRHDNGLRHPVAYCLYAILESDMDTPWILGDGCHCSQSRFPWSSEGGHCIQVVKLDAAVSYGTIIFVFDGVEGY